MQLLLYCVIVCLYVKNSFGQAVNNAPPTISLDDQKRRPEGSIQPLTTSQIIFLNTISNVQQPGIHTIRNQYGLPGSQTPRITAQHLHEIDWSQVDRRAEDGWWHLYPFGERYFDRSLSNRPWMEKQIDLDFFLPYYGFRFNYTFVSF
jgi:hypothetical protein